MRCLVFFHFGFLEGAGLLREQPLGSQNQCLFGGLGGLGSHDLHALVVDPRFLEDV